MNYYIQNEFKLEEYNLFFKHLMLYMTSIAISRYIFLLCFNFVFENSRNVTASRIPGQSLFNNRMNARVGQKTRRKGGKPTRDPGVKCDPNPCMCYVKGDVSNHKMSPKIGISTIELLDNHNVFFPDDMSRCLKWEGNGSSNALFY